MRIILIISAISFLLLGTSCSSKVIVKNCKSYIGDYQKCELVE